MIEGFYDIYSQDEINNFLRIFFIDIGLDLALPLQINTNTVDDEIIFLLKYFIENFSPIMLFYEKKDLCENIIRKIYENRAALNLVKIHEPILDSALEFIEQQLGKSNYLTEYLRYGLAFHHAGLPGKVRGVIEELIRNKFIKIFSCTTTFAQGINFPVHSIFFHSVYLYSDLTGRMETISPKLFLNIVGRAGRALKYNEGVVLVNDPNQEFRSLVTPPELTSDLSNLTQYSIFNIKKNIYDFIENNNLLSNLQVDLLSFDDINKLDLSDYLESTYFFAKLKVQNQGAEIQKILPYFKIQKEFLQNFIYPNQSESVFRESGLNLVFCKKLYDYLITNQYSEKFLNLYNDGEDVTKTKEFSEINRWIFQNLPDLSNIDPSDFILVNLWINRSEMNYKHIYNQYRDQADFFQKLKIINNEICTYFPWVWTVILGILENAQPILQEFMRFIPYFIKFGVNSFQMLIDEIYENTKDFNLDGKRLTREKIMEILDYEEEDNKSVVSLIGFSAKLDNFMQQFVPPNEYTLQELFNLVRQELSSFCNDDILCSHYRGKKYPNIPEWQHRVRRYLTIHKNKGRITKGSRGIYIFK